eukprot:3224665-Karenia_brevis.AAC.1
MNRVDVRISVLCFESLGLLGGFGSYPPAALLRISSALAPPVRPEDSATKAKSKGECSKHWMCSVEGASDK